MGGVGLVDALKEGIQERPARRFPAFWKSRQRPPRQPRLGHDQEAAPWVRQAQVAQHRLVIEAAVDPADADAQAVVRPQRLDLADDETMPVRSVKPGKPAVASAAPPRPQGQLDRPRHETPATAGRRRSVVDAIRQARLRVDRLRCPRPGPGPRAPSPQRHPAARFPQARRPLWSVTPPSEGLPQRNADLAIRLSPACRFSGVPASGADRPEGRIIAHPQTGAVTH